MAQKADNTAAKERRRLRGFGLTVGIAFCVLAALLFWKTRPAGSLFAGLGAVLLLSAFLAPIILKPVERVWMKMARIMGWFMTRVILGVVFVALFTPAGLIVRLLGKDPLQLRKDSSAPSYWHRRPPRDPAVERMERMF